MDELQKQYNTLLVELESLRQENAEMKALLFEHGLSFMPKSAKHEASIVSLYSPISLPPVNLGVEQRIAMFNGKTYYGVFTKDLAAAKHSIVISSPKLYALQRSNVVNIVKELSVSGLDIIILTRLDDEQSDYLRSHGLSVRIVPSLSLCCTIIDKQQVWYGSVNALGYANEEDSVIKLSDSSLANVLINEIFQKHS